MCNLKYVCEKLVDPKVRFKRQNIEVGKLKLKEKWKKCKFDGSRMNFFSRSSSQGVYGCHVILQNIGAEKCILMVR